MNNSDLAVYLQRVRLSERVELKAPLRSQIERDVEKFLSKGNEITVVGKEAKGQILDPRNVNW